MTAGLAWAASVGTGFALLYHYKAEPGAQVSAPDRWPAGTSLRRHADRATLVMFAHPGCPCTRASLGELARLLARESARVGAQVVLVEPRDRPEGWAETDLAARAAAIPGVAVVRDLGGEEARRFEATVSGFVSLYDTSGNRLFSGGLTPSRGHEGDSFGRRRILAALHGQTPDQDRSPVFGCALALGDGPAHDPPAEPGGTP